MAEFFGYNLGLFIPIAFYGVMVCIALSWGRLTNKWPHWLKCVIGYGLFFSLLWWVSDSGIPESPVAAVMVLLFMIAVVYGAIKED